MDFDETRKIGEGGYGSVYFGVLGEKVRRSPFLNVALGPLYLKLQYL